MQVKTTELQLHFVSNANQDYISVIDSPKQKVYHSTLYLKPSLGEVVFSKVFSKSTKHT